MPGDVTANLKKVIEQKRQGRMNVLNGIKVSAGRAYTESHSEDDPLGILRWTMAAQPKMSVSEFAARIREKYPDYNDASSKISDKYDMSMSVFIFIIVSLFF